MSIKYLAQVAFLLGVLGCDSANDPGDPSPSSVQPQSAGAGGSGAGGSNAGGAGGSGASESGGGPGAGGAGETSGAAGGEQGKAGAGVGGASAQEDVSFRKDVMPIFETSCAKCHQANGYIHPYLGPSSAVSASQVREALFAATDPSDDPLVVPGSPETSFLVGKLTGEMSAFLCAKESGEACGKQMPPPSAGSPPTALAQQQIDLIRDWISQGAKDN